MSQRHHLVLIELAVNALVAVLVLESILFATMIVHEPEIREL